MFPYRLTRRLYFGVNLCLADVLLAKLISQITEIYLCFVVSTVVYNYLGELMLINFLCGIKIM